MSYCTLEEAWGSDFKKKHRKSKKEKRLESQERKNISEAVDPQILIPETHRMADYRKDIHQSDPDKSNIQGFDESDMFMSPYQRYAQEQVQHSNENILISQNKKNKDSRSSYQPINQSNLLSDIEKPIEEMVQITKKEYNQLKNRLVEGFANQTDEQFNQLLLFVFTGILYLYMLDMMYQLGKKSY